jgi:hypothetical protein
MGSKTDLNEWMKRPLHMEEQIEYLRGISRKKVLTALGAMLAARMANGSPWLSKTVLVVILRSKSKWM